MSDEETKGEAVELSVEESLYNDAIRRYQEAGRDLDQARNKLREWEAKNGDINDATYAVLDARLQKAEQRLQNADQRLQNARQAWKDADQQLQNARAPPVKSANASAPAVVDVETVLDLLQQHQIGGGMPPSAGGHKRKTEDTRSEGTKKPRRDIPAVEEKLREAMEVCNLEGIFKTETILELPFPSLATRPDRFQLDKRRCFKYQAREDLSSLHAKVLEKWNEGCPVTVNVAGTIGYGKSHMLAALVLLLLKKKKPIDPQEKAPFVCYIPDCRTLLDGEDAVVGILMQNIVLNMPDFCDTLDTIKDIRAFLRGKRVILVADQWNSIDDKNEECREARNSLSSSLGTSVYVTIRGMSMNAGTWSKLRSKQKSYDNEIYYGGFSDDEFGVWLKDHPDFFTEHKDELALLTGKVPLLLSVFARVYKNGDSWESVVQHVQQDETVRYWFELLQGFYDDISEDDVWKVYTLSADWLSDAKIVDHRFFKEGPNEKCVGMSEIVMRLLYRVWSWKTQSEPLLVLDRWKALLSRPTSNNPSVLGFDVEEIIKAKICKNGVGTHLPQNRTIKSLPLTPTHEEVALEAAISHIKECQGWVLLNPKIFNYPGVDMILVTEVLDNRGNLTRTLVGINVTIAKKHSLMAPFFNTWRPLADKYGMGITGLFVAPDDFMHEEKNVEKVSLKSVFPELWEHIQRTVSPPQTNQGSKCGCKKNNCGDQRCGCQKRGRSCSGSCECAASCTNGKPSS